MQESLTPLIIMEESYLPSLSNSLPYFIIMEYRCSQSVPEGMWYSFNNVSNSGNSKVSRFYETGVKSYIGEQLIEFGFPVDAIKRIEDNNLRLLSMHASASQKYILEHLEDIKQLLDSYERGLLDKALKSICS